MEYIESALRLLFALFDGILGWVIGILYTLIIQIANVNVFGDYIYEFMGRIYAFLAIFMLFKLSISVVNYVLNPDQLTDKSKGFGKLIQNVIVVIGLVIMTPQIFDWAYKLQSIILNTNVLYTVVTGRKNSSNYDYEEYENLTDDEKVAAITNNAVDSGEMLKYELMATFIYSGENDYAVTTNDKTCFEEYVEKNNQKNYGDAFNCLLKNETINKKVKSGQQGYGFSGKFANDYKLLISTACLVFVAYIFIGFCFDVALRSVRLGVLQLIAPIPIISMLDPNSGKSGMFSKWLKDCKNTYLSLFIRLLGIFFAMEMISVLTSDQMRWQGTSVAVDLFKYPFVKLFIIIGILMFAKQLPQFIESLTGMKMDGGGFNLKKKLGGIPGVGGAIGLGGGMAANAIAGIKNKSGFWKTTGSALAGGLSGGARGLFSGEKDQFKAGRNAIKGAVDKRNLRAQRNATGYTWDKRMWAGIDTFAGVDPMSTYDNEIKAYDDIGKQAGSILSRANGEMIKYGGLSLASGHTMAAHKREKERLTALENTDTSHMTSAQLFRHTDELSRLRDKVNKNDKEFAKAYVSAVQSGTISDSQTRDMVTGLNNAISSSETVQNAISGISTADIGSFVKDVKDRMEDKKAEVTNSADYMRASANKKSK